MNSPSDNDKNKDAANDAKASGENKADKNASAKETLNKIISKTGVLVGKIFSVSKAATKDAVQELRNVNSIRKETVATAAEGTKKTDLAKTFWTKTSGKQRGMLLGSVSIFAITISIITSIVYNKNLSFEKVVKLNAEYRCQLVETISFENGREINRVQAGAHMKPYYIQFDGNTLKAYYKVLNAPAHADNGAKFDLLDTEKESGRVYTTIYFSKEDSYFLNHKIKNNVELVREQNSVANALLAHVSSGTIGAKRTTMISRCE